MSEDNVPHNSYICDRCRQPEMIGVSCKCRLFYIKRSLSATDHWAEVWALDQIDAMLSYEEQVGYSNLCSMDGKYSQCPVFDVRSDTDPIKQYMVTGHSYIDSEGESSVMIEVFRTDSASAVVEAQYESACKVEAQKSVPGPFPHQS